MTPIVFSICALILFSPAGSKREMTGFVLAILFGLTVIVQGIIN